jgi:hypothetical protein
VGGRIGDDHVPDASVGELVQAILVDQSCVVSFRFLVPKKLARAIKQKLPACRRTFPVIKLSRHVPELQPTPPTHPPLRNLTPIQFRPSLIRLRLNTRGSHNPADDEVKCNVQDPANVTEHHTYLSLLLDDTGSTGPAGVELCNQTVKPIH